MKTPMRALLSIRDQIGALLQKSKPVIVMELLVVALFPISLAVLQIPRSIIPLFLMGWLSLWLRRKSWKDLGFRSAKGGWLLVISGSVLAISGIYLSGKIFSPLLHRLTGEVPTQAPELALLRGNLPYYLFLLAGIWLLAAIGEELVYRGYVLNRLIDIAGPSPAGWGIGLLVSSLLFGLGHGTNLPVIVSGFLLGLVEGGLYLASRRNLWLPIVFHGFWDSTYLTLFYLGLK